MGACFYAELFKILVGFIPSDLSWSCWMTYILHLIACQRHNHPIGKEEEHRRHTNDAISTCNTSAEVSYFHLGAGSIRLT